MTVKRSEHTCLKPERRASRRFSDSTVTSATRYGEYCRNCTTGSTYHSLRRVEEHAVLIKYACIWDTAAAQAATLPFFAEQSLDHRVMWLFELPDLVPAGPRLVRHSDT